MRENQKPNIQFPSLDEPEHMKGKPEAAASSAGVMYYLWYNGYKEICKDNGMEWQAFANFTSRHDEIFAFVPSKCSCIKQWAMGNKSWEELMDHLNEELMTKLTK